MGLSSATTNDGDVVRRRPDPDRIWVDASVRTYLPGDAGTASAGDTGMQFQQQSLARHKWHKNL